MSADDFIRGFFSELVKVGQMAPPAAPTGGDVMGANAGMRLPTRPTNPPMATAAKFPRPSIMPAPGAA